MDVRWLPGYCGNNTPYQAFWNNAIMVDTVFPDMTDCFRETVMTGLPGGCMFLLLPIYLYWLRQQNYFNTKHISRGWLYWSKMTFLMILSLLKLIMVALSIHQRVHDNPLYPLSFIVACLVIFLFQILTAVVVHLEFSRSVHSSSLLFPIYLLLLVTETTNIWSYGLRWQYLVASRPLWDPVSVCVSFVLTFVTWILILFVDSTVVGLIRGEIKAAEEHLPLIYDDKLSIDDKTGLKKYQLKSAALSNPSPEETASPLSRLYSVWFLWFIWQCLTGTLKLDDVYDLPHKYKVSTLVPLFFNEWDRKGKNASLFTVLTRCFWKPILLFTFTRFPAFLGLFLQPIVLRELLHWLGQTDRYLWRGIGYSIALMSCNIMGGLMFTISAMLMQCLGSSIRAIITAAIFRKSLRLSKDSWASITVGEVVNYVSVDAQRIQDMMLVVQPVLTIPLIMAVATGVVWIDLGWVAIMILVIVSLMIPLNGYVVGRYIKDLQVRQMLEKDKRLRMLSEMLSGVKILKLYAWERGFIKKLTSIRDRELVHLGKSNLLFAVSSVFWNALTNTILVIVYMAYILVSSANVLTPGVAFVMSSFVQILQIPTSYFVTGISYLAQSAAALKRIDKFLHLEELDSEDQHHKGKDELESCAVKIQNGYFTWSLDEGYTLQNINLEVEKGRLVAIVGHVGSGKSSLIATILGDINREGGDVSIHGNLASVPQLPWIRNCCLRDNIIMNQRYRESLYNKVIDACALRPDLDMLVDGDRTEIGQKGINLSGGQKQRVSLARAVYQDRDIYLLDDPLSAVDSHVAKHLFQKVIGPHGVLRKKTRILVTNNVTYLPQMDTILMLQDGNIIEHGTYQQLMMANGPTASFVQGVEKDSGDSDDDNGLHSMNRIQLINARNDMIDMCLLPYTSTDSGMSAPDEMTDIYARSRKRRSSVRRKSRRSLGSIRPSEAGVVPRHILIGQETVEEGAIKLSSIKVLLKAIPFGLGVGAVVFYLLFMASLVLANLQLASWTSIGVQQQLLDLNKNSSQAYDKPLLPLEAHSQRVQLAIYASIVVGQIVTCMIASVCLAYGQLTASRTLHSTLLARVFHAPMSYFDTTPTGRILNRLSRDIDVLDFNIPAQLRVWIMATVPLCAVFISIVVTNVWFIFVLLVIILLFGLLLFANLNATRQLRRIESVHLSPLLVHFDDTLNGLSSIKAYQLQDWFIERCDQLIENLTKPVYLGWITRRWSGVCLITIGGFIVLTTAVLSVATTGPAASGEAGMTISVAMQAVGCFLMFVNTVTELNSYLVALERIKEYSEVPQEVPYFGEKENPRRTWPELGHVHYDSYSARYRPGLDLALRDLNLDINPGEKVAVVGRTGAGKSSLSLALFRIFEGDGGRVTIDGKDISRIELEQLRSKLTTIPQDPVVFSGTLRMNLDPYDSYMDDEIWAALDQSHLGTFIRSTALGLSYECGDNGEALSLGQRQLLCLARALLRKSRVLVLDEATAAVDPETDDLIQMTIRQSFKECTIITIAHRLTTVLDYDRIGVLDSGRLVEFDSPQNLLNNPRSVFFGMAQAAGITAQIE